MANVSVASSSAEPSFAELLEASFARDEVTEGEIVKGTIISVHKDHVLVDVGFKSEGMVALNEFPMVNGQVSVKSGDSVDVLVESKENDYGLIVLSKEKADKLKIWDEISAACERDEVVEGVIVSRVKGGLSVDIGVKAFLPGSQVDLRPIRNLDKLIGEKYKFKVIKFNKKRGNSVLSLPLRRKDDVDGVLTLEFAPPAKNGAGDSDWVLLLETAR